MDNRIVSVLIVMGVALVAPHGARAETYDDFVARRIAHEYARCIVQRHHTHASEALLSDADNGTILSRYPDLVDGECLGKNGEPVQMDFSGDLYRYALADALVNADFGGEGEVSFADRLPLSHLPEPRKDILDSLLEKTKSKDRRQEIQSKYDKAASASSLSHYGECVVRHDPIRAHLWLLTKPDTSGEASRIDELRGAFADCLNKGTVHFSRVVMRGAVAINYYRLAMAAKQPTSGRAL